MNSLCPVTPFVAFIALMQSVVEFDNVGLRYGAGVETLTDISFTLYPGSFHFLTGASGAGKTSLLKLLYLAHRPSRGAMRMFGHDTITLPRDRLPGFRRRIGVVFQDFRLVAHLSTFDNIALPLRIAGVQEKDLRGPVTEMLAWIGLTERADARQRRFRAVNSNASPLPVRSLAALKYLWPTSRREMSIRKWPAGCFSYFLS
jgi:ABC-type lipoprotein export system ATPase subunit